MLDCQVAVIGAGPAGCSAATVLARTGIETILIEKFPMPRQKTCGGGLVYRARKILDTDITPVVENECSTVDVHFSDLDLYFSISHNFPIITTVKRDTFDFHLLQVAQNAGASIRTQCEVQLIEQDDTSAVIRTNNGDIEAQFIILAEGAHGHIAKRSGWLETRTLVPGIEAEITTDDKIFRLFSKTARFDFGVIHNGYGWIFPKRNHFSAGLFFLKKEQMNLKDYLKKYIQKAIGNNFELKKPYGFVIPIRPRQDTYIKNRILLAGDTAGLADPLTGEGITNAILSGKLAARSLIETQLKPKDLNQRYTHYLKTYILKDLKIAGILSTLFYCTPRFRNNIFHNYASKLVKAMSYVFSGEKSYSDLILSLKSYIKLLTG